MTDTNSLAHSKWNCKYHIVFAPKYRRQVIYTKIKADIGQILRKLCEIKKVEILEANAIHMLLKIPPNLSVAQFMGYLKGKSSLMIFDRHANLKYRYGNRHFWCRGYYVDCIEKDTRVGVLYAPFACVLMVEATGFEPTTSWSRTMRATICATPRQP